MSWAIYPAKPGSKYGPCDSEDCGHTDCTEQRHDALQICPRCKKPIGYEHRVYRDKDGHLEHALCLEQVASYRNTVDNPRSSDCFPVDRTGQAISRLWWID